MRTNVSLETVTHTHTQVTLKNKEKTCRINVVNIS